jgi:hypothetical protein
MGKVNVVLPDGRTVSVDEETAKAAEGERVHQESSAEADVRREAQRRQDLYGNSPVSAGLVGAADTLTLGAFGKVAGAIGGRGAKEAIEGLGQENPGAHLAGELGAFALPTGILGGAGKAAAEASGLGFATRAGERAASAFGGVSEAGKFVESKLAGRLAEGAVLGAGAHIAATNVTGDPLTIEGVMEGVGVGGVLGIGAGAIADRFGAIGDRAQGAVDERSVIKSKIDTVKEGRELFARPVESWQPFVDAVEAKAATQRELFTAAEKATNEYSKFVNSQKLGAAISKTENTINTISRYWRDENVPETLLNTEGQTMVPPVGSAARKPTISPEMRDALKDWRDRLRRVDMIANGGFDVDASQLAGRWVKADVPGDPARALEELRALRTELQQGRKLPTGEVVGPFPKAIRTSKWADLPDTPPPAGSVPPPEKIDLPETLLDFAKKRADTVARIRSVVEGDPAAQAAFQKVVQELGTDGADGVAGLHQSLGKYIKATDELKKMAMDAEAEEVKGGIATIMRNGLKKFVGYGTARAADTALGGGWLGAFGRVAAGEATKAGMSKFEDTMIGGALLNSKIGIEKKTAELISKWMPRAGKATEKLGDVTTWLSQNPITGERDTTTDLRKQAANRVNDIIHASLTAPDAAFTAVQPLLGHPSDAGWKIHAFVNNAVNHLLQAAPKDPGLAAHMLGSDWTPGWHETIALAHRLEAVADPLKAIARSISGDGHPAAHETLWAVWPNLMAEVAHQASFAAPQMKGMTYEGASGPSQLMRAPLTGLQEPIIVTALQGLYLPKPQAAGGAGGPQKSNQVGRPAAVKSQVAGSNVQNLIS